MSSAKDIHVAPIASHAARAFVREHHYSGRVVRNSQLHIGAFIGLRLVGVAQFGPPMSKGNIIGLVRDTAWNNMMELNRLVMVDDTPKNAESRFLSVCFRLMRKFAPHVEWVLSYSDATQCGDGTIYRAAGFVLTKINQNSTVLRSPDGKTVITNISLNTSHKYISPDGRSRSSLAREAGYRPLPGYQLQYIYFLNPAARERLTVPVMPFSAIEDFGAGMYLGQRRASAASSDAPAIHAGEGGAAPTLTLHTPGERNKYAT